MNRLLIEEAEKFATNKHRLKLRKDGKTPYIEHPREVVSKLLDWKYKSSYVDEERKIFNNFDLILCTAWLHDTIEKTETKIEEITFVFGDRISSMVSQMTFDETKETEQEYFLRNQYNVVKFADHICNTIFFMKNGIIDFSEYFKKGEIIVNNFRGLNFCTEELRVINSF